MIFAKVIVNQNSYNIDRLFTYIVPIKYREILKKGHRVLVPFGRGNKPIEAYVVEITDEFDDKIKLKEIIDILDLDPLLTDLTLELALWIKERYLSTYIESLNLFIPKGLNLKIFKEIHYLKDSKEISIKEAIALKLIKQKVTIKESEIEKFNITKEEIKNLIHKELIELRWNYKSNKNIKHRENIILNENSINLIDEIKKLKNKRAYKQVEILEFLKYNKEVFYSDLKDLLNISRSTLNSLEKNKYITIEKEEIKRTYESNYFEDDKSFNLNEEQLEALDILKKEFKKTDNNKTIILHGITGSGKTEVYIDFLANNIIGNGKEAVILVPEIALTPQILFRFKKRFKEKVSLFHSRLSEGEKFDEWRKVNEGQVKLVIGARSALFLPFKNLGAIIIDEFHESSYKSEFSPYYDSIEISKQISERTNAILILGSATPSIEEYYKFKNNYLNLVELKKRVNNKPLPQIEVVDMKEELLNGNKSIFSQRLIDEISKRIIKKEQVILFLNKRGHSSFVLCRNCGYVFKCKKCDISLTYHKFKNTGLCHYCGYEEEIYNRCPSCKSSYIKEFGIGTQRVELELKNLFEHINILRMDKDTTSKKGDHEKILNKFKDKKADILIGTQMITKGLDFENVTLVGIISPDSILNFPDYKSPEKTFQLITQVAGRSGRGLLDGLVILQTYEKDHYAIKYACEYNFIKFYEEEIELRRIFKYPPFNKILRIIVSGLNENLVKNEIQKAYDAFIYLLRKKGLKNFDFILGPNACSISKINDKFRWQFIMKDDNVDFELLKNISRYICYEKKDILFSSNINISLELNPNNLI